MMLYVRESRTGLNILAHGFHATLKVLKLVRWPKSKDEDANCRRTLGLNPKPT